MKAADKYDGEMSQPGRKHLSATELIKAVEHGVNRELKFYAIQRNTRSQIRELATGEALMKITSELTQKEVKAECRSIVRRLLNELVRPFSVKPAQGEEPAEGSYGWNGQLPASQLAPQPGPLNRNWVEDKAIARIDNRAAIERCIGHLSRESREWFLTYALAARKPANASKRMKFSRERKRLLQLELEFHDGVLQTAS